MKFHCVLAALVVLPEFCFAAPAVNFSRDVRPILSDRCFHCHGPNESDRQAELRLDQADGPEGAYRVLYDVQAVKPGSLEGSELWRRINSGEDDVMPPPDSSKDPLNAEEKEIIKQWIEQGAEYAAFWAFVPPAMPDLPEVDNAAWNHSPIDRLVMARLQAQGLTPSPQADRRTLIRRLSLDLTGLPPTREEIAEFLADTAPGAYARQVDRLLAKPQYGEHMTKYWLDLVRFADTNGIHHDHYREMTPYRDWVIRAFNDNLGYDDFVRFQLAGDLFPEPTRDQLIASGFNRLHLIIDRGTALPEESYTRNVIDRVTAAGTAFLGLTVQCAVCHDHKYDPITTQEFYQLFAFFNNLDGGPETGGRSGMDFQRGLQPPYIWLANKQQEAKRAELTQQIADLTGQVRSAEQELKTLQPKQEDEKAHADEDAKSEAAEQATGDQATGEGTEASPGESPVVEEEGPSEEEIEAQKKREEAIQFAEQKLKEAQAALNKSQSAKQALEKTIPVAMVMQERQDPRPAYILLRGQYDKPGQQVQRDTPAFLPPLPGGEGQKTRMDLAEWFVAPQHPLTARVAVNRFWQQLFGVGIVKTAEDFGAQGEWPSHPELLDYLAVSFVESGWDVKALMRQIVTSETYRQASAATPEQFQLDPENRRLARGSRFRLDSEVIRDQVLATSGLLNRQMYGISVKPPQPDGLWASVTMPSSYPRLYQADTGDKIYRRSVYTFWKRGMPPPQMTILNAPSREACIARRERTNTPLQALLLMNEAEYLKAARHLALEFLSAADSPPRNRVAEIYETITAKLPDESESAALLKLLRSLKRIYTENPVLADQMCEGISLPAKATSADLAAWTMVASTIYNLDITKTRD